MANLVMNQQQATARLEVMLKEYHDALPIKYRVPVFGSDPLRDAVNASPDLKAKLIDAISDGYLTKFTNEAAVPGAAAEYRVSTRDIKVPESALDNKNDLIFLLGHENQHARSLQGIDYRQTVLKPDTLAISQSPPPHDYTAPITALVERTRAEEAQAHIGGFNAVVSALTAEGKGTTPEDIYRHNPGRMRDFIDVGGVFPNLTYQMKAGLTQQPDGSLDWTPANVTAMKGYYADKIPGSFGDNGLLNYRHDSVMEGWRLAHGYESVSLAGTNSTQNYTIDFTGMGINPGMLNVPNGGPGGVGVISASDPIPNGMNPFADFPTNAVVPRHTALTALGIPHGPQPAVMPPPLPTPTITDSISSLWNKVTGNAIERLSPETPTTPAPKEPPLFAQAIDGLGKLGKDSGVQSREEFLNAAAALAVAAEKNGLTSIDHVEKGSNGNVFAVQGQDVASPLAQRAHIEMGEAVQQPSQQNLSQLQPPPQVSTPEQPSQHKPHSL
ncbi:XVIPCD domain-containing protein [Luteimonas panaciterrae]|uniref:XVIPCD domain-containing protein n=1 Tax=Luteimonas panaciterrae TaxID=363885 RepID=UPI001CFA69D3|nr:XVIPCD domain-containing protein [Luteimonas panaciterrae]